MKSSTKRKFSTMVLAVTLSLSLVVSLGCNAQTIQAYINLAVQIALQVATLAGVPPALANQVAADLAIVEKLITDYNAAAVGAKPGIASQIDTALNTAQADLGGIFTAAHIADPKLQATIQAALAIGITAIESIRAIALANAPVTPATAVKATVRAVTPGIILPKRKVMTPAQLKALYNSTVSAYPQAQLK
jgi:hypothetical protein